MRWVTREKIKVDRVACPWLIKKFIDADAEFVFRPRDTDWATISDGIVFDMPDCELGHHGEDVSFNSIMKKYKLGGFGALGLSDNEILEREFIVYDALYAECKRRVKSGFVAEVS